MPEMNGFEFCEAIHAKPAISIAPFVVMSSRTDRSYMSRMVQMGAGAYICKPFNIDELVILIEKILSDQFILLLKEKERLESERRLIVGSIASLIVALEARDKYTKQVIPQINPGEIGYAFHRAGAEIAEKGHFWMETN
ncbi:MAG: response regulator [Deltaproteobacteria bacterium]|nr:response regulator [Deltaproteobacteria bacterium]